MVKYSYGWLLPFMSFIIGYYVVYYMVQVTQVEVPLLIGKTVDQALSLVTERNLTMRLLYYKEENEVPSGIILSQTPSAQQKVKPYQSLFLVVAKQPQAPVTPELRGMARDVIKKKLAAQGVLAHVYGVPSTYPSNQCVAQVPAPGEPLTSAGITLYCANTQEEKIVWPSFKGKRVEDVMAFLQSHDMVAEIVHTSPVLKTHTCHHCLVVDQRPLPGAILVLDMVSSPLRVQLQVE